MTARRNPPGAYKRIEGQWRWVDDERPSIATPPPGRVTLTYSGVVFVFLMGAVACALVLTGVGK